MEIINNILLEKKKLKYPRLITKLHCNLQNTRYTLIQKIYNVSAWWLFDLNLP